MRVRADNPSPLTLDGTNTYVVEGWVVDPGPDDPAHLDAILRAAPGGVEGIVLTHGHPDHDAGAPALAERASGACGRRSTRARARATRCSTAPGARADW